MTPAGTGVGTPAASAPRPPARADTAVQTWESEGGHLRAARPPRRDALTNAGHGTINDRVANVR